MELVKLIRLFKGLDMITRVSNHINIEMTNMVVRKNKAKFSKSLSTSTNICEEGIATPKVQFGDKGILLKKVFY